MPGFSSFPTFAVCNALRLLQYCQHLLLDPEFASLEPCTSLTHPMTAIATLHHYVAKVTSSFSLACPLGWAKQKLSQLGHWPTVHMHCTSTSIVTSQEPDFRSLQADGLWRGRLAPTPPQQLWGQATRLTDHMVPRFCPRFSLWYCPVAIRERAGRGQEFVLVTGSLSAKERRKNLIFKI